ncbi:protein of unknown function [Candidatus Nitrospira inopinata]|uniref:Uncharacterized protein n=1 Tax=Candidatus Nitrospira inopinata TaxID=1715989 RepID=A0A0S4KXD0_9BACT|nr:protein of unknown function [Candidatus Nitrospira inopinata]
MSEVQILSPRPYGDNQTRPSRGFEVAERRRRGGQGRIAYATVSEDAGPEATSFCPDHTALRVDGALFIALSVRCRVRAIS